METLHQAFQVEFRYPVHFTADLFASENPLFAGVVGGPAPRSVLFVIDEGVRRHHPGLPAAVDAYCRRHQIPMAGAPRRVPGGERVKKEHDWVLMLHHAIERAGLCRHSFLAAIGGGAVLDMAGLAAATAHRGVRLIRIPTTVLSQNDSGVGVKNGINAFGKKNFLGTFAPPYAVLNDAHFLTTLSDRDWRSGIAEAIKVALIRDAAFFDWLEGHVDRLGAGVGVQAFGRSGAPSDENRPASGFAGPERLNARTPERLNLMQRLIYRCAELHLQHIATGGDPFEMGSARPLDFGHWAAHKLEQLSGYRLRHGEAVAIGIALDTTYSLLTGLIPETVWRRVLDLLSAAGLGVYAPELSQSLNDPDHPHCVLRGLREFREHLGGELTITLLDRIGRGIEVHEVDERRMVESIRMLERQGERPDANASVNSGAAVRADGFAAPEHQGCQTPEELDRCHHHDSVEGEAEWRVLPTGQSVPAR